MIEVTPAQVERLARPVRGGVAAAADGGGARRAGRRLRREEVYYREALALGLDRDDTVIRRRLRQKMEFLSDAGAEALAPSEAELRAHLQAHPDRFARPARVDVPAGVSRRRRSRSGAGGAGGRRRSGRCRPRLAAAADDGDGGRDLGGWDVRRRVLRGGGGAAARGVAGAGRVGLREPPGAAGRGGACGDAAVRGRCGPTVERDWRQEKAAELREAHTRRCLGATRWCCRRRRRIGREAVAAPGRAAGGAGRAGGGACAAAGVSRPAGARGRCLAGLLEGAGGRRGAAADRGGAAGDLRAAAAGGAAVRRGRLRRGVGGALPGRARGRRDPDRGAGADRRPTCWCATSWRRARRRASG